MQIKPSLSGWERASNFTKWNRTRFNWDPMWSNFKPRSIILELGTTDNHLSMKEHVQRICQSSFHQLRQIRTVCTSLTRAACESLVHAFVSSRLDYCNSMLFGINESLLDKLESVLRTAARLVLQKRKFFDLISTDIRDKLQWLPIRQRIVSKSASLSTVAYTVQHQTISPRCWLRLLMFRLSRDTDLLHWELLFRRWLWEHFMGQEASGRPLQNSGTPFPHFLGLQIQHWLCLKNSWKTILFARAYRC